MKEATGASTRLVTCGQAGEETGKKWGCRMFEEISRGISHEVSLKFLKKVCLRV